MKLFLVVLLAGVWSTTAAPHATPNIIFQEYGLDIPVFDNFQNVGEVLKCIQTAIDRVVEESDLGQIWDETKNSIDQSVSVEWPKCVATTNKYKKLKCQANVAKNVADTVNVFVKQLAKINKWELVQEIKEKVLTWCFESNEVEEFDAPFLKTFLARFECIASALGAASNALGLQSLWEKSQPQLVHHLGQWKQCQQVENTVFRYFCEAKEGATTFVIVSEYIKLAAAQQPKFVASFGTYYKQDCTGKSFAEEVDAVEEFDFDLDVEEFAANPSYYNQFACVAKSLDTVSKAHGLESLWAKAQPKIEHSLGKWNKCLASSNPVYAKVCQVKPGVESFIYMTKYIKLADAKDPKFAEAFAADHNKNCADHSYANELVETFVVNGIEACVEKLVQKIKCVSEAITESVQGTHFEQVWAEAHTDLTQLQNKLVGCASSNEAVKCITETLKESYSLFAKFLKHLKEANYDAYNKIKQNIKKKCYTA
ncbi:uncharacterized protein LOC116336604 [Contarinia nasturtii]|uniref:uncharacterized protein LOC116336604 n=1 Tax=Contarinia nasturtii TaxID=265458 RepID=UPI0012D49609|nr:uncharacterized protein LOC116336604 [Contarinia nasturtii]